MKREVRGEERKIIHVDMDAFYASVEEGDNPHLRGKAIIVGGRSKRGVVCAASYEARKYGVHSAMATEKARKLCPRGIYLPPRMNRYSQVSKSIMSLFREYTDLVEPLSLDEAYLDVTVNKKNMAYASKVAREIKREIRERTGLTASAGVAPNKFVAKIASDFQKPDGLVVVPPQKMKAFIDPLPVRKILGVGRVMEKKLVELGIRKIGDLAGWDKEVLKERLGKAGAFLHDLANGVDERAVNPHRDIKSMGEETTFIEDLLDREAIEEKLKELTVTLCSRLEKYNLRGRTVTLKVKYHDFSRITRSHTLWFDTSSWGIIFQEAVNLFAKTEIGKKPVRLIGISLSHMVENPLYEQLLLFNPEEAGYGRIGGEE